VSERGSISVWVRVETEIEGGVGFIRETEIKRSVGSKRVNREGREKGKSTHTQRAVIAETHCRTLLKNPGCQGVWTQKWKY